MNEETEMVCGTRRKLVAVLMRRAYSYSQKWTSRWPRPMSFDICHGFRAPSMKVTSAIQFGRNFDVDMSYCLETQAS